jgi:hypothetical protein
MKAKHLLFALLVPAWTVGTKGSIHTTGHNMWFRMIPEDQFQNVQKNRPETVEAGRDPEQDWFAACRGGKPAWSNFD